MIDLEKTVLILLAAGRSSRFPNGNKLEQEFLGRPVGLHVAVALEDMPFLDRIAVVDGSTLDYGAHGFRVIHNDDQAAGMSHSVGLGVAEAKRLGAEAVLIALADMPRVTAAHIYRMLDAADSADAVVASSDGAHPRPPALFARERFDFLMALEGDEGARRMVRAGRHVVTARAELVDIDTPEDLERLRTLVHSPPHSVARPSPTIGDAGV
ncbi:nucleotidyltransferase family protein [Sphingomonas sp. CROZ-RG-20F-R02-07]|uniref:nucleotidyltransferase family protein n=1 Tax=Sphingomonas sp. CROZ-RG-20F-R02-07 TaxID=2914832 RepID=UPI001F56D9FF|nr:nucleotidyltransferase family protein [Sphingomonas sp. CROZ-RG-20F-R02-07]